MNTFLKMSALVVCFCFFASLAHAEDANVTFGKLKTELQAKGMSSQDLASVEMPVKDMLKRGASKDEIKGFISDLRAKGVSGAELQNATNSMNELVKSGEKPRQAGSVVSQAAFNARAQGLKGKDLAASVQSAVRQRKTEMEQARMGLQQKQRNMQANTEMTRQKTMKEVQYQHREMNKAMNSTATKTMKSVGGGKGR